MPTVIDKTVVNSAYDTSGNGGRKLVRLDNGWLVAIVRDANNRRLYKSVDNGTSWTQLCFFVSYDVFDYAIASRGNFVYIISPAPSGGNIVSYNVNVETQTNIDISTSKVIVDSAINQNQNSVTVIINNLEIHTAFSVKHPTYPNSFNIRYAKGTINADGSVTWGAVEQVTTLNATGSDNKNPTIYTFNGVAYIVCDFWNGTTAQILVLGKSGLANASSGAYNWRYSVIYTVATYTQSSPQGIFVPQSINGLANGRIWVAWHGIDSVETNENVRVSYSDDGGITWSAMQKLTTGQNPRHAYPSITANKNNDIFITISRGNYNGISKIKYSNGSWGTLQTVVADRGATFLHTFPSTLFDLSLNFTEPLFIYKDTAKVGFYGTWTVTNISVPTGSIGEKTDKNNLLSYAITTDGAMSQITEKVNGFTLGTKTATSGQTLTVGLTQEQWDVVRFGKYANVTGGKNTLTIEMGSEKWTYTFDKRLATDSDMLSIAKSTKDTNEVFLPSVKSELISKIFGKGGVVVGDKWEDIEKAIGMIELGKKYATGTVTVPSGTNLSVSGLPFQPYLVRVLKPTDTGRSITYFSYHPHLDTRILGIINVSSGSSIGSGVQPVNGIDIGGVLSGEVVWEAWGK